MLIMSFHCKSKQCLVNIPHKVRIPAASAIVLSVVTIGLHASDYPAILGLSDKNLQQIVHSNLNLSIKDSDCATIASHLSGFLQVVEHLEY